MGVKRSRRGGKGKGNEKRTRQNEDQQWRSETPSDRRASGQGSWTTDFSNAKFEAFYRAQGFMRDDADWDRFMASLRSPLPACFRVNPNNPLAAKLKAELAQFTGVAPQSIDATAGVQMRPSVEQIAWFPNGMAYKLGTDRRSIRRTEGLEALHRWMIQHTDNGNITRQEAVSMVPPLALDVHTSHRCLDMCAAPGSKTTQLLEVVSGSWRPDGEEASGEAPLPQGIVVANDADTDRAYMLVHQCRRIASPLLVVTTHKGQYFPSLTPHSEGELKGKKNRARFFDRVLCDVPCSGDGTLRKSPHIWTKWNTGSGVDLHPLQLMIARRGAELLRPGGLMVYSTCSMSPYEDEAVVAELLRSSGGALELVDARVFLPALKCRPGVSSWLVLDDARVPRPQVAQQAGASEAKADPEASSGNSADAKPEPQLPPPPASTPLEACLQMGMRLFGTPEDVPDSGNMKKRFRQSLFPPSEEEAAWMHLERCLRCLPQDEDTGGFFVATLRKRNDSAAAPDREPDEAAIPAADEPLEAAGEAAGVDTESAAAPAEARAADLPQEGARSKGLNDYVPWDSASFERVKEFYGLKGLSAESIYVREDFKQDSQPKKADAGSKSVYYLPPVTRELLESDHQGMLKCVAAGIKVLERKAKTAPGEFEYRLVQDGVDVMTRHVTSRAIDVNVQDFCNFLGGGLVSFNTLSPKTVLALCAFTTGSIICTYKYTPSDVLANCAAIPLNHSFHIVCYRGVSRTLNVMCSKIEIDFMKHQFETLGIYRDKISAPSILRDQAEQKPSASQDDHSEPV